MVAQGVADRADHAVGSLVGPLRDGIADVVHIIGVVARAADHGIRPRPAVEHVVALEALDEVAPSTAVEAVVVRRSRDMAVVRASFERRALPYRAIGEFHALDSAGGIKVPAIQCGHILRAANIQIQAPLVARDDDVAGRDAFAEAQRVFIGFQPQVVDQIEAIAAVEKKYVVAGAAFQVVVAGSTPKHITPVEAVELVVAIPTGDRVRSIRADQNIAPFRTLDQVVVFRPGWSKGKQFGHRQRTSIGKAEAFDPPSQIVVRIGHDNARDAA